MQLDVGISGSVQPICVGPIDLHDDLHILHCVRIGFGNK